MAHGRLRPWHVVVLSLLGLVAILSIALDPIATWLTRKKLDEADGFRADFQAVSISLFPLAYTITRLKFVEMPAHEGKTPVFYAGRIRAEILWRDLFKLHLAGRARIEDAKLTWVETPWETPKNVAVEKVKERLPPPNEISRTLRSLPPFKLDRIEVLRGQLLLVHGKVPGRPAIWIHEVEATFENLASRRGLAEGLPATLAVRAKVQQSGILSLFMTADPLAPKLTFAGEASLKHLDLRDLHEFLVSEAKLKAAKGSFDSYISFKVDQGRITGAIKPMLRDVELDPAEKDFGTRIKARLADSAIKLLSDRVPGREAVVTVVPIHGSIDAPAADLWPSVLALVRNAFVEGLAGGFAHVPPPTAAEKESGLTQARRALSRHPATPIKAQPDKGDDK